MNNASDEAKGLAKNIAKGNITLKEATNKLKENSTAAKLAAGAVKVLNTAFDMLTTMAISAAISAIIQHISSLVNAYKESIDKIEEYSNNVKSLEGDIKSLNDELSDNAAKLRELEKIKNPTLFQQDEIDRLKEANKELKRQIQLKEYLLKIEIENSNKAAQEAWDNTQIQWGAFDAFDKNNKWYENVLNIATLGGYSGLSSSISNLGNFFQGNLFSQQERLLKEYENTLSNFDKIKSDSDKYSVSEFDKASKKYEEKIAKHESELLKRRSEWETQLLGLDPTNPANSEIIKQLQSAINTFDNLYAKSKGTISKNFTDVFNKSEFADITAELKDLAKAGKLTESTFNNVKGIKNFKEALEAVGITDVNEIIRAITVSIIEQSSGINNNGVPSVNSLAISYDELSESIKNFLDLQDKLTSAFEKVKNGEVFSPSEALDLLNQFPELYNYISEVEGGFTFTLDGLRELYRLQNQQLISQIEENNRSNQEVINYYNEQKNKIDAMSNGNDGNSYGGVRGFNQLESGVKLDKYLEYLQDEANKAQDTIDKNATLLDILNNPLDEHAITMSQIASSYDKAKSSVDGYNKNIQTIDKAIQSMNNKTALSYDEMLALVDISPQLVDSIQERTDGYYIEISALDDLKEASYKTRESFIQDRIAETKKQIETTNELITSSRIIVNLARINSIYDYANYLQSKETLKNAPKELAELEDTLDKYEALLKGLYNNGSGSGSKKTDPLQNELDYYNNIIKAIEAVTNKKIEAVDKEIEALNAQKDALEDSNDERQRELDLIEARNNLDKAKKRTVFVFDKDKGFVETADKKAIDEAQQKYDEVLNKAETAKIDKQIEELNKVKDSYTKYKEGFTNMPTDISNTIIVEQVKKALGLKSNDDLLNLSETDIQDLVNKMAEVTLKKDYEDNKDNAQYTKVTLSDVLKNLGASVSAEDFRSILNNMNNVQGDRAAFASYSNSKIGNVNTYNSPVTITNTFNISGATDPQETARVVNSELNNFLTQFVNRQKQ